LERKAVSGTFLTLLLTSMLTLAFNIQPVKTEPTTKISVDPPEVTKNVGETFSVRVNISDITNLYGFDISFWWDSTLLNYVSHKVTVPVEANPGGILHKPVLPLPSNKLNKTAGTFRVGYISYGAAVPFTGSGTVFNMTFKIIRTGACYLHFYKHDLCDNSIPAQPILHEARDGEFHTLGAGYAPFASFTFSPERIFVNKTTVIFDASYSYDPDPGGAIVVYMWDFGDGNAAYTTNPIITHVYTKGGYYSVALQVRDISDSLSFPHFKTVLVQDYSDVKIDKVTISPPELIRGLNATIDVTFSNIGITSTPPFNVAIHYNKTATEWVKIEEKHVNVLPEATTVTLTFTWNTTDVTPRRFYSIMANTTLIENDVDLNNNIRLSDAPIYIYERIHAAINIDPDTLNLRSMGQLITAYIQLPEAYDVAYINISTIMLNETVSAELIPTTIGDYDNDIIPDLMVKFDRAKTISYILGNVDLTELSEKRFITVTLTLTGRLNDGTPFQGSDTISILIKTAGYGRFVMRLPV